MASNSVTRSVTIFLMKHPNLARKMYPTYIKLVKNLPKGYDRLVSKSIKNS